MILLIVGLVVAVAAFFTRNIIGGMFGLYRIVPVNEVHIRIMDNKKQIFSSRTGKSSYWVVPFITKLHKLPLSNIDIPTDNIKLNDINMAKFVCDIMCFINIDNIELAVERLTLTSVTSQLGFDDERLGSDLRAIMESIGRTVATKQTILEIYMNRQALVEAITKEVQGVFPKWGISLVNLELRHIRDAEGSTIIADIERLRASEIRRDADIKVAVTEREAKIAQAEAQEAYKKREIQKDQTVAITQQEALIAVQKKTAEANIEAVEARRKLDVGQAEIAKQITEQTAMAARIKVEQEAEAQRIKFETESSGQAKQILAVGQANADMIKAKLIAEAEGTKELAAAMKEFKGEALSVKQLEINKEIMVAKYAAVAKAMENADIKWIMSGDNAANFFGLDLSANGGANLQQFLDQIGVSPEHIGDAKSKIQEILGSMTNGIKRPALR